MLGILLVEDDEDDARLLDQALGEAGLQAEISVVPSGEAALRRLESGPLPAVMVLDLTLPGMSGLELLRRVRGASKTRALPVVVLTGSPTAGDQLRALDLPVDEVVLKPEDFGGLVFFASRLAHFVAA